jgi:hypothetical protein
MGGSTLNEQLVEPDENVLKAELEKTYSLYITIKSEIMKFSEGVQPTWKYYGKKNGWLLKLMSGKRNVLFIVPQKEHFRISFTFGDSVFEDIMNSDVKESIKNDFFKAKKYAEGRTFQLKVENEEILHDIKTLIKIKLK